MPTDYRLFDETRPASSMPEDFRPRLAHMYRALARRKPKPKRKVMTKRKTKVRRRLDEHYKLKTTPKPKLPPDTLYCSFCGKSHLEVRKLISGPTAYICDECVRLCVDILIDVSVEAKLKAVL